MTTLTITLLAVGQILLAVGQIKSNGRTKKLEEAFNDLHRHTETARLAHIKEIGRLWASIGDLWIGRREDNS